ncbi:hypothetical protein J7I80_18965 [Bacillus sp. ISL-41]|uniref:DUF7668 domain-containing protein n=1 Tax=Bacillus sp. ISL-41 TaxID=2819127 RepID=UPI001BE5DCE3|nr:hypothetical protein [Bacillus sp. ISL-41]MBT2644329.1 hypothetical protein [Bacillus sp. ISL-41]
MQTQNKIKELLLETILELVKCDFIAIQGKLQNGLTINDLREELGLWALTVPPDAAYENVAFYKYNDGSGYALEFELWIDNQSSDLTLSCEALLDENQKIVSFTIENLHVL